MPTKASRLPLRDVDTTPRPKKHFSKYKKPLVETPDLVSNQVDSYKWLIKEGIKEVFKEFSPISDYSGKKFQLDITSFELSEPKYDEYFAKDNKLTYEAPLRARFKLLNKTLGSSKEQEVFMADFPLMTNHGTFIINGVERVIVPQLARSFGVFFDVAELKGKRYFGAKIIPSRGVWVELQSDTDGSLFVRIDKKRKFGVTALLRAMGLASDQKILELFPSEHAQKVIKACLEKDPKTPHESYIEIYKRLRDGDLATAENAKEFVNSIFDFNDIIIILINPN